MNEYQFVVVSAKHGHVIVSAVAGLKLLGGPNLHFYCSTLVFNIYFLEFAKLLGGARAPPAPPHATALIVHKGPQSNKQIVLLMHDSHFDVITKLPGFFDSV